jgi:HSP20 family protein
MFKHSLLPSKFDQSLDSLRSLGRELEKVEKSFFNLWRDIPFSSLPNENFTSPNIDVIEDDKAIKVIADLPGLEEKDIAIEVNNGVLTLRGEKKNEKEEKQDNYWKFERSEGYFYRSLQLPTYIDENNVEATLKNGVLKITIPKLVNADTQKKRIAIKQIK